VQIGPADRRQGDAQKCFAGSGGRPRHFFHTEIVLSVKNICAHRLLRDFTDTFGYRCRDSAHGDSFLCKAQFESLTLWRQRPMSFAVVTEVTGRRSAF
jgi:hypothetical protein